MRECHTNIVFLKESNINKEDAGILEKLEKDISFIYTEESDTMCLLLSAIVYGVKRDELFSVDQYVVKENNYRIRSSSSVLGGKLDLNDLTNEDTRGFFYNLNRIPLCIRGNINIVIIVPNLNCKKIEWMKVVIGNLQSSKNEKVIVKIITVSQLKNFFLHYEEFENEMERIENEIMVCEEIVRKSKATKIGELYTKL